VCRGGRCGDPLFSPTAPLLAGPLNHSNDGLVKVESAKWGTFMQCVPADHLKEVGVLSPSQKSADADLSIEVDDLDEALKRMKKAKVKLEYGPADGACGERAEPLRAGSPVTRRLGNAEG
jgi:hypothetical protein